MFLWTPDCIERNKTNGKLMHFHAIFRTVYSPYVIWYRNDFTRQWRRLLNTVSIPQHTDIRKYSNYIIHTSECWPQQRFYGLWVLIQNYKSHWAFQSVMDGHTKYQIISYVNVCDTVINSKYCNTARNANMTIIYTWKPQLRVNFEQILLVLK